MRAEAVRWLSQQEQEEAQRLFESHPDGLPAERTFEPGEGLAEAEGLPQDEDMEAVPEPTVRKGPTPEQITAIKVCCDTHPLSCHFCRLPVLLTVCQGAITVQCHITLHPTSCLPLRWVAHCRASKWLC